MMIEVPMRLRYLLCCLVAACSSTEPGPTPPPAPTDAGMNVSEETPSAERGRILYRTLRCANCHGADARGIPTFPGGPMLIGRSAANLKTALTSVCADPLELSCHPLKLPDMTDARLADIAAYLAELARDPDARPDPGPPCDEVPGNICTLVGTGISGNRPGDGVLAREQSLFWPQDAMTDPQGRLIVIDWNNYLIRRVEKEGCRDVTDAMNRSYRDCPVTNVIGNGGLGDTCKTPAKDSQLNHPIGLKFLANGHIAVWAWHDWKVKIVEVKADGSFGNVECVFGNARGFAGDGMAAGTNFNMMGGPARFNLPSSSILADDGTWYISDQGNLRIRRVLPGADDAPMNAPFAMWIASLRNNVVETFAGGTPLTSAGDHRRTRADYSDSGDGGPLWELDAMGNRVNKVTFNVQFGFDALPQMRMDLDRMRRLLYVADAQNHRIRVIDLKTDPPTIDTVVGGGTDVAADGAPARQVKLNKPGDVDVFLDGSGDLLISDVGNHCVRVYRNATRTIHTVAGVCGQVGYGGDGGPATMALFDEPGGAGIGPDGKIYIADTQNHRVRRVNPR